MLFLLYYLCLLFSIAGYYFFAKKVGVGLYSISHAFFLICVFLAFLPGYYVVAGTGSTLIYEEHYRGFDIELYVIYLITIILTPSALILGASAASTKYFYMHARRHFKLRYCILILFLFAYAAYYFQWLPSVPLNILFFEHDLSKTYASRLLITHGFTTLNPPFIISYWRLLLQLLGMTLFLISLFLYKSNPSRLKKICLILFFLFVSYTLVFNIEKASFFYFIIMVFIANKATTIGPNKSWSGLKQIFQLNSLVFYIAVIGLLVLFYYVFMGGDFSELMERLSNQTASNYLQIEHYRNIGAEGFASLGSNLLNTLFNLTPKKDLSTLAYIDLHGMRGNGYTGSAAGMFSTVIYFSFGWWFAPLTFIFVFIIGYIDKIATNSVIKSTGLGKNILTPIYISSILILAMRAFSSPSGILSPTYILSPWIIFYILIVIFFLRSGKRDALQNTYV